MRRLAFKVCVFRVSEDGMHFEDIAKALKIYEDTLYATLSGCHINIKRIIRECYPSLYEAKLLGRRWDYSTVWMAPLTYK